MPGNAKPPYLSTSNGLVITLSGLALAFTLSVVAVFVSLRMFNIRCFTAQGVLVLPTPVMDGGLSVGKVVLTESSVESRINWWLSNSSAYPTRISYRGPITNDYIGPYALTLCGGETTLSCEMISVGTCFKRSLPMNCNQIDVLSFHLDANDTQIEDGFFNITGFTSYAKSSPHLFYISIEYNGTEIQRGGLGTLCTRDDN
jgi:hypothetical protein